jgi:hypothetical protein
MEGFALPKAFDFPLIIVAQSYFYYVTTRLSELHRLSLLQNGCTARKSGRD